MSTTALTRYPAAIACSVLQNKLMCSGSPLHRFPCTTIPSTKSSTTRRSTRHIVRSRPCAR